MRSKEFGSDFSYCSDPAWHLSEESDSIFSESSFQFFVSGRAALHAILQEGIERHGWKEVYLPSYYCHEVVHYLSSLAIEIREYSCNPFTGVVKVEDVNDLPTTVVVNVDYFGYFKASLDHFKSLVIIDDCTHGILQFANSTADYCFASLRKELPVPVGGYVFSPKGGSLPRAVSSTLGENISVQKLSAMYLKSRYLKGELDGKDLFRILYSEAEAALNKAQGAAGMPATAAAVLGSLNVSKIIAAKKNNWELAMSALKGYEELEWNLHSSKPGLGLIVRLRDAESKSALRDYLISKSIYPVTLWPDQKNVEDKRESDSMIFIHVDFRYDSEDIIFISNTLREYFRNV